MKVATYQIFIIWQLLTYIGYVIYQSYDMCDYCILRIVIWYRYEYMSYWHTCHCVIWQDDKNMTKRRISSISALWESCDITIVWTLWRPRSAQNDCGNEWQDGTWQFGNLTQCHMTRWQNAHIWRYVPEWDNWQSGLPEWCRCTRVGQVNTVSPKWYISPIWYTSHKRYYLPTSVPKWDIGIYVSPMWYSGPMVRYISNGEVHLQFGTTI